MLWPALARSHSLLTPEGSVKGELEGSKQRQLSQEEMEQDNGSRGEGERMEFRIIG